MTLNMARFLAYLGRLGARSPAGIWGTVIACMNTITGLSSPSAVSSRDLNAEQGSGAKRYDRT